MMASFCLLTMPTKQKELYQPSGKKWNLTLAYNGYNKSSLQFQINKIKNQRKISFYKIHPLGLIMNSKAENLEFIGDLLEFSVLEGNSLQIYVTFFQRYKRQMRYEINSLSLVPFYSCLIISLNCLNLKTIFFQNSFRNTEHYKSIIQQKQYYEKIAMFLFFRQNLFSNQNQMYYTPSFDHFLLNKQQIIMLKLSHQICIVGAGPVGLALANCLSRSPHIQSIALIDRKMPAILPEPSAVPNQRVFSINAPSLQFLDRIGAMKYIRQSGSVNHIQVISKQSQSFVEWQEKSAKIIQNDELVSALMQNLKQGEGSSKVEFIEDSIQSINNQNHSQSEITLKQKVINTKLLIGSDGSKSKVKFLSQIPTYGWKYQQKAIACTLQVQGLQQSENNYAYQIFHDSSILGILPLWGNYISIVWSLEFPEFDYAMKLKDDLFLQTLNNLIKHVNKQNKNKASYRPIGRIEQLVNKRLPFPLNSLQAENYAKHRVALVGDAAHSIHPLAGLGVNSGILDSILLANNIISNKKAGNDIGEVISLSGYQSASKTLNYGNSLAMQGIKKMFEIDIGPFSFFRTAGLDLVQHSDLLKGKLRGLVEENPLVNINSYEWEAA